MIGGLNELKAKEYRDFSDIKHHHAADPSFIPVHLTGGVGDVVMAIDAMRWLASKYEIVVYCHHLEAFKYFAPELRSFKTMPEYTWHLEFNTICKFHIHYGFKGFLVKEHRDLFEIQQKAFEYFPALETIVRSHYEKFHLIAKFAEENSIDRREFPIFALGFLPNVAPFKIEPRHDCSLTITIHDGFDIHNRSIVSGRATKQWDWKHWCSLVKMLQAKYPDYKIIQLGTSHTSRVIDGVDECLIDKTSITEAFDIVSKSRLHIDGDSGLVHAATKLGVDSVVLWGPTPNKFYGYGINKNIRSDSCPGSCYGLKTNWNDKCPIGHATPICMDKITPEMVMDRINL